MNPWMDDKDNTADEATLKAWFTQLDYLIANASYQGHPNPTVEELKVISLLNLSYLLVYCSSLEQIK